MQEQRRSRPGPPPVESMSAVAQADWLPTLPDLTALDGLRAIAEAVQRSIGGAVLITDPGLELIAHHVSDDGLSADVQTWIVHRHVPESVRRQLVDGRLTNTWPPQDVLRLGGPHSASWTVALIRDGARIVGGLWAIGVRNPRQDARVDALLVRAARQVAAHLGARATRPEDAGRVAGEHLGRLLGGRGGTGEVDALTIGPASRLVLLHTTGTTNAAELPEAVRLAGSRRGEPLPVAVVDQQVYVLAADEEHVADLAALAARDRLGHTTCLVSEPVTDLTALAALRVALDDLVVAGVIGDRAPVVRMEDHWSLLAIADIARLTPTAPRVLAGPLQALADLDRTRGTAYLQTLAAYFDDRRDLTRVAERLHVHRNTVRYRIERIQTLTGVDLTDPIAELVLDLQLRIVRVTQAAEAAAHPGQAQQQRRMEAQ